ncbi:hypothetical protein D3C80_1562140 [compost metagenome]
MNKAVTERGHEIVIMIPPITLIAVTIFARLSTDRSAERRTPCNEHSINNANRQNNGANNLDLTGCLFRTIIKKITKIAMMIIKKALNAILA